MSLKRQRANEGSNLLESFGALLRQSTSRAMERLRLQVYGRGSMDRDRGGGRGYSNHNNNANTSGRTVRPIDRLVIIFALYYFSVSDLVPPHHFLILAQDLITKSEERVRRASQSFFEPISTSLALFCETLVEEYASVDVEDALNEMEEFVMIRERIGEYIVESSGGGDFADEDDDDDNDAEDASGGYSSPDSNRGSSALLGRIYKNLDFFVHIRVFLHALSRDAAANAAQQPRRGAASRGVIPQKKEDPTAQSLSFQPRYEHQMLKLLVQAVSGSPKSVAEDQGSAPASSTAIGLPADGDGSGKLKVKLENDEDEEREAPPQTLLDQIVPREAIQVESSPVNGRGSKRKQKIKFEPTPEEKEEERERTAAAEDDDDDDHSAEGEESEEDEGVNGSPIHPKQEGSNKEEEAGEDVEGEEARLANEIRQATATALLADLLALSHVPSNSTATPAAGADSVGETNQNKDGKGPSFSQAALHKIRGVNAPYYQLLHARLGVMVARQKLHHFAKYNTIHTPPPLTPAQKEVVAREAAAMQQHQAALLLRQQQLQQYGTVAGGVPLDFVPDQAYFQRLLGTAYGNEPSVGEGESGAAADGTASTPTTPAARGLGEDEELFTGEIMDYYMRRRPIANIQDKAAQMQQFQNDNDRRSGARNNRNNNNNDRNNNRPGSPNGSPPETVLVKPHRVCKVKTGFTWTQYNRTHYDSRTNPPPKSVMWYDFTLFYPALANTKRNPLKFFRVEDTPKGPNDEFCLLVFSVGPPYADVAYRIERKQWDPRPGGVRISFDANGKFRLFFRFSNSNYRR